MRDGDGWIQGKPRPPFMTPGKKADPPCLPVFSQFSEEHTHIFDAMRLTSHPPPPNWRLIEKRKKVKDRRKGAGLCAVFFFAQVAKWRKDC